MNADNLCPGCMREVEGGVKAGFCPDCGYNFATKIEPHRLKPGTRLHDKYIVGKVLGEGGFGITYLGYDSMLEMKVAIKEYYPAGFATRDVTVSDTVTPLTGEKETFYENGKGKFIKEARTLAKFSNLPGIVSVRDFFEDNHTSYIIMEYLEGETLKTYLKRNGGVLPPMQVASLLEPVVKALAEVHKQGIIHRDISPDNMMILPNGNMKLLDFGAAREQSSGEKSVSVMLKPGYAPEEQYRTHGIQGPWTDVYGISGTIYRCLTGHAPIEAMERMRQDTVKSPLELGIQMEPWRSGALMKGLSLYAENRFQSMEEFYNAYYLNRLLTTPVPPQAYSYHEEAMDGESETIPIQNPQEYAQQLVNNAQFVPQFAPSMQGQQSVAPMQQQNNQTPGGNVGPQFIYGNEQELNSKKKSKKGLIIGLVSGGVALIGGIITAILLLGNPGSDTTLATNDITPAITEAVPTDPAVTPEPTDVPAAPQGDVIVPAGYFTNDYSKTVRGHAIGDFYGSNLLLLAQNGVPVVADNGKGIYTDPWWYLKLDDGFEIKSIAMRDERLYLACGEKGMLCSDITVGGDVPIILSENITSFAFSDAYMFYIELADEYDSFGTLYVCDPDGNNSRLVHEKAVCDFMRSGSCDFEYVNGRMYFIAYDESHRPLIYSCANDGTDLVAEYAPEDYNYISGLYYNGGKLYTLGQNPTGIYSYDIKTKDYECIIDSNVHTYMPLAFADESVIYAELDNVEYKTIFHRIYNGVDSVIDPGIANSDYFYDAVDGNLICMVDFRRYYGIDYEKGAINSCNEIQGLNYYDQAVLDKAEDEFVELEDNYDYRASFMQAIDLAGSYVLIKNNQWSTNHFGYSMSSGYTNLEKDDRVQFFSVIDNYAYYTVKLSDNTFEFRRKKISSNSAAEVLLDGSQMNMFCVYDNQIYYENYSDGYSLYKYDPAAQTNEKIMDAHIGFYYLLNGCIYYEDYEEKTVNRAGLDGTGKKVLFSLDDLNVTGLETLIAFNNGNSTYLAFMTKEKEMIVCTEDATVGEVIASGLEDNDLVQDVYFDKGCIFYPAKNATEIHRLRIEDFLNDDDADSITDEIAYQGNFVLFEVNQGIIFVEDADDEHKIHAIDEFNGDEYNTFNFDV